IRANALAHLHEVMCWRATGRQARSQPETVVQRAHFVAKRTKSNRARLDHERDRLHGKITYVIAFVRRKAARSAVTGEEMLGRMMVSALALTGVAYAQQPVTQAQTATAAANAGDRVAYDAAFFSQFNPQNALDMVNQTPGFSLNSGED